MEIKPLKDLTNRSLFKRVRILSNGTVSLFPMILVRDYYDRSLKKYVCHDYHTQREYFFKGSLLVTSNF